jgi:hypothetical protein
MSFTNGFAKTAGVEEVGQVAGRLAKGLKSSGASTVGDALKLKGLSHISKAVESSGGIGKSLTTKAGRGALAEGVGKAAPSIGALGAYGYAGKKVYDKASNGSGNQGGYY